METVYIMKWSFRSEAHDSCYSNIYSVENIFFCSEIERCGEMHSINFESVCSSATVHTNLK